MGRKPVQTFDMMAFTSLLQLVGKDHPLYCDLSDDKHYFYSTVPWGEWDSEFDTQNVDKLPYLIIDPFSNKKVISCHVIDCIHNIGCRLLCISNNTNYCYLKINNRSLAEHFLSWDHWNDSHCQQNSNNHLWRTTFLYYRLKAIKS